MTSQNGPDEFAAVCPYLGLADDADSHATYATEAHRCYRLETPTRIATPHQETYCLGANHTTCPVYRGEGIGGVAPAAAAAATASARAPEPPRGRPPVEAAAPVATATRPAARDRNRPTPERPVRSGQLSPRPRPGGISMPVATIGLFALAVIVLAVAFLITNAVGGDDDGKISPADAVATNQALHPQSPGATVTNATQTPGTPGTATNKTPGTPGTASTTQTPGGANGAKTYTVKSGDFCSTIAEAQGTTLQALLDANDMTEDDCTHLTIGQVLKLP